MAELILIDFYSEHCGPCRALAPVLDKLQGITVVKSNVYDETELAVKHNVSVVPTLVFLKDGEVVDRLTGLQTLETLQGKVDELK